MYEMDVVDQETEEGKGPPKENGRKVPVNWRVTNNVT